MMQNGKAYLSVESFEKAEDFLRGNARPLEVARFESLFMGADVSCVWDELRKFQNADGGFGHGLEPDLRTPESSALCTSIAFQIMREHGVSAEEEMVRKGIAYLKDTLDRDTYHWRIIPKSAGDSPHAPWWGQNGRDEFELNPTAEILGYLYDYGDVEEEVLERISGRVVEAMRSSEASEMHNILCCARLLESKNLPPAIKEKADPMLRAVLAEAMAVDPERWKGYCLYPLLVISSPHSIFLKGYEEAVSQNLDYEISTQQEDGAWHPIWTWEGNYPEAWETAEKEWAGEITLNKLRWLERFGRIENRQVSF